MKTDLGKWALIEYISAAVRGLGGSYMRPPSANAMITGVSLVRAFRGVTAVAGKVGSRLFFNTDETYAGLGTSAVNGTGSVFQIRRLLAYIGLGQVQFDGANITGAIASSTLSFIKKVAGVYAAGALTGPFQAGHAQPSAPTIYAKTTPTIGQTLMNGVISLVIWRVSDITGQVSLMSLPSNVIALTNQSAIVKFPLIDSNGQNYWGVGVPKIGFADLGVFYELPTSLKGEVAETEIAYTRSTGSASIVNTSNVVDAAGGAFTSADIGRRLAFGTYDSWITAINSGTQVQMNDTNNSGATITATGTITHAVQGITRAVELSWSNGALQGQRTAPDKAFPPPAGQFAGVINDVVWLESDGIIYVGEPGQIGSFPPSNALFPNEPAVQYVRGGDWGYWRWGKQSLGILAYVGGSPALEYQTLLENQGILYPQNVSTGARGRMMIWLDKPVVMAQGIEFDEDFEERAEKVAPDFAGWENQTADTPVVPGYDGRGKYEVWCYLKKVMPYYVPKRAWCAPIDLTGKVGGNIVSSVTHRKQLYLTCLEGANLVIYQFDVGTGSVMVVQTDDTPEGYGDTISEVYVQGRIDNTANAVKVDIIKNFNDAAPIEVSNVVAPGTGVQHFARRRPDILNAKSHAVRVTMTSTGGDTGVDKILTYGSVSEVVIP